MLRRFPLLWPRIAAVLFIVLLVGLTSLIFHAHTQTGSQLAGKDSMRSSIAPDVLDTRKWGKVFDDEFSGNSLNSTKWASCYDWYDAANRGCTNGGNDELEWYTKDQVAIHNGTAVLTAEANPYTVHNASGPTTYPYRSGMISTGRAQPDGPVHWSATYGYFEARIKMEGGRGIWPAFWLLPTDKHWPPEIDIMEFLGNTPNQVLLNTHWADGSGTHREDPTRISGPNFTRGWHTYAINWQPDSIAWYVDGKLQKQAFGAEVPHKDMEIILNLAVGGRLPGNPDVAVQFPRTMQIDYVHVYGKKL